MIDACTITRYRPEMKDRVAELQTQLWSRDLALNAATFTWKYERNPYLDEPLVYVALDGDRLVGMRGFYGMRWVAGRPPVTYPALYADDLVVTREYRDRGLVARIMSAAFEDLARRGHRFVFNLSAGSVTFVSSLASGWRTAGPMRPMRWRSRASAFRARGRALAGRLPVAWRWAGDFSLTKPFPLRRIRSAPRVHIEETPRCEEMSRLAARVAAGDRIRHVRDAEYLAWRLGCPLARYRYLVHDRGGMDGYMILRQSVSDRADRESVAISDWQGVDDAARRELLRAAIECAAHRDLVVWSATLDEGALTLLREHGFVEIVPPRPIDRQRPALLVRILDEERSRGPVGFGGLPLLDLASWDLRMLDSTHG